MSYFEDFIEPNIHLMPKSPVINTVRGDMPWIGKDRQRIKICEMGNTHLINAHSLLGKRLGGNCEKPTDADYYALLRVEINKRELS